MTRYKLGQEVSHDEVRQVYRRITGKPLPRGRRAGEVAKALYASAPLRFEFEVNRLRGYAWEADE